MKFKQVKWVFSAGTGVAYLLVFGPLIAGAVLLNKYVAGTIDSLPASHAVNLAMTGCFALYTASIPATVLSMASDDLPELFHWFITWGWVVTFIGGLLSIVVCTAVSVYSSTTFPWAYVAFVGSLIGAIALALYPQPIANAG